MVNAESVFRYIYTGKTLTFTKFKRVMFNHSRRWSCTIVKDNVCRLWTYLIQQFSDYNAQHDHDGDDEAKPKALIERLVMLCKDQRHTLIVTNLPLGVDK